MERRRRISAVLAVVLALVPAVVLVIGLLVGDRERIEQYVEVATIRGGTARVEEVIDYDFGAAADRHGIYRILPDLTDQSSVTVSSPTAPDDVTITGGRIRIGDPTVTINGSHRYEIGYDLSSLVVGDRLAWNVVGTEWDVPVERVEAHVISDRSLLEATCDQGSFGAEGGCEAELVEPGHLVVRAESLAANHGITLRARLGGPVEQAPTPPAIPGPPGDTGAPLLLPAVLGVALAAIAALVTGRVLRVAGREHAPPGLGTGSTVDVTALARDQPPRPAPPPQLTPAQGGVVWSEVVRDEHKAAWLLGHAQAGTVSLEGDDPKKPLLRWQGGGPSTGAHGPLFTMFSGRESVQLGEYDPQFASGWKMVEAELAAWKASSGLWSDRGERVRRWALGLGIAGAVVFLLVTAFLAFRWSLGEPSVMQLGLLCLPVGAAIGAVVYAWELRVRTAEGTALYLDIEAFRRFLEDASADDVAAVVGTPAMDEYLAWAVALRESKSWIRAVEPTSAGYDPSYLLIASTLHSSTSSAATAPSSSGGSGGGGVGGGGGGGGGGSW